MNNNSNEICKKRVERLQNLTEEELRQCYDEMEEYNKTGFLQGDTLVRKLKEEHRKILNVSNWDSACSFTCNEIYKEIARRYMKERES